MEHYLKENRAEIVSTIYNGYKQDFHPVFEIDNLTSKIIGSKKIRTIHCNSLFAEKTIKIIIDYFNEQFRLSTDFKNNVINDIKKNEFAYQNDNQKLESLIEENATNTFQSSANGMEAILEAFTIYSDFKLNSDNRYLEDIEYVVEAENQADDSSKFWLEQTIEMPWFK